MKKALLTGLSLALVAVVAVFGTLAYYSDTDSDVNVQTLGNVSIEQIELQRADGISHTGTATEGALIPFEQGQALYPAYPAESGAYTAEQTDLFYWGDYVTADSDAAQGTSAGNGLWDDNKLVGAMDKMVFVKNTGESDCYYRTIIAFECPEGVEYSEGSDKEFMMNVNGNRRFDWANKGYIEVDGTRYLVMVATYTQPLPAGTISRPSLLQVVMTHNATNEDAALCGDTYDILVLSQACQTENLPADAATALNTAFGEITTANHPWVGTTPVKTVATSAELSQAVTSGVDNVILSDGTYTLPAVKNDAFTVIGNGANTVIEVMSSTGQNLSGTDITFENLTVKTDSGTYDGIQHAGNIVYNNVVFDGGMNLYGESVTFNNCTFNLTTNYLWTYGAGEVAFNNCTFNTDGKAILIYAESHVDDQTVNINNCTFNATQTAHTGQGDSCAAVEIDSSLITGTYTVNFTGNNVVDSDFSSLYRIKNTNSTNVTIND